MIRREGRLDNLPTDVGRAPPGRSPLIVSWERPLMVAALIAILVLGGIFGMKTLISMFPT